MQETIDSLAKAVTSLGTPLFCDPLIGQRDLPCSYPPPWSRAFLFVRAYKHFVFLKIWRMQNNARR
jgi:hypothetical protein